MSIPGRNWPKPGRAQSTLGNITRPEVGQIRSKSPQTLSNPGLNSAQFGRDRVKKRTRLGRILTSIWFDCDSCWPKARQILGNLDRFCPMSTDRVRCRRMQKANLRARARASRARTARRVRAPRARARAALAPCARARAHAARRGRARHRMHASLGVLHPTAQPSRPPEPPDRRILRHSRLRLGAIAAQPLRLCRASARNGPVRRHCAPSVARANEGAQGAKAHEAASDRSAARSMDLAFDLSIYVNTVPIRIVPAWPVRRPSTTRAPPGRHPSGA